MDIVKSVKEILRIPSLSGHERNLADHLFTDLLVSGLKPSKQDGNVIVKIAGKNPSKALVFNAHMDTVSPGALSHWKYPPYGKDAGIQVGDKIFGLGASDDKASIVALLGVSRELIQNQPPIDVWIVFVTDEETGGNGTKSFLHWFAEKNYLKQYAEISTVICEPTSMEEVRVGHRGNMNIQITYQGESGHASEPHLVKKQAILEIVDIIGALKKLEKSWQAKHSDPVLGKPTIAITAVQGGDSISPNKFPDSCSLTIDVRTTPTIHKKALPHIMELAKKMGATAQTIYDPAPPGYTDPEAKIVLSGKKLVGKIGLGKGSTDLCFFSELDIPGIILGPGNREIIHKPNEFCEVSKIKKAVVIYQKLISLMQ